jgi:hypothetical protein
MKNKSKKEKGVKQGKRREDEEGQSVGSSRRVPHWTLDVIFREDDSCLRLGYSTQNFLLG